MVTGSNSRFLFLQLPSNFQFANLYSRRIKPRKVYIDAFYRREKSGGFALLLSIKNGTPLLAPSYPLPSAFWSVRQTTCSRRVDVSDQSHWTGLAALRKVHRGRLLQENSIKLNAASALIVCMHTLHAWKGDRLYAAIHIGKISVVRSGWSLESIVYRITRDTYFLILFLFDINSQVVYCVKMKITCNQMEK